MESSLLRVPDAAPPPARPLLAARDLHVSFGDHPVLDGIDFVIWPGELVALIGENGAGKSTLVRCIAGDLTPSAGEVLLDGSRVRFPAAATEGGLAVVWQDLAFCDNLDVGANLLLGRERGWFLSPTRSRLAARAILESYHISVPEGRPMATLSRGQRQVVAVARAMQSRPRLLVLDEPTASLGVVETRQVEELIGKLQAEGTTVLIVSHDIDQVFNLADRIAVLHRGRIVADLAPAETSPDDVVAIMSGHEPDATARAQLSQLQSLVDQLASATPNSTLPLIVPALAAASRTEMLCIHLRDGAHLSCAGAQGLPPELAEAWANLEVGPGGGPIGLAAATGHNVIDEDVERSAAWAPFRRLAAGAGIRSSWSVPVLGSRGLIGVISGYQNYVGRPHRDQLDLVSLYSGYAAGAIERDLLFGEVTTRNRVLETIRAVLEDLAGPEPVSKALLLALRSLQRGLRATEVELWVQPDDGPPARCLAFLDGRGRAHADPPARDQTAASGMFRTARSGGGPRQLVTGTSAQVVGTTLESPGGHAVLIARWDGGEPAADALALLADAANSVHLALERGEAEQAHQQTAALIRSHQLQRDFLSRLSHELRTPLTAIRGYASSLLASDVTWDDESTMRFLSRIEGESARLSRLVGDLLDFSAIESGLLRLQTDWCDLALIIEAAVSCLSNEELDAVTVDCAVGIGPVWGDHDRLEQVFVNLLENAFKHNARGVKVRIEVSAPEPERIEVRVRDDGQGIPAELRAELFESRARGATLAPGSGLGLSIAKAIVAAHGGEISLEEEVEGASFHLFLPVEGPEDGMA